MRINIRRQQQDLKMGFALGGLLLSPFAKILSVVLAGGLLLSGGFSVYKMIQVKNLELKLVKSENELIHVTGELQGCQSTIDLRNQELLDVVINAEEDINKFKDVNEQLGTIAKVQEREIGRLVADKAPLTCDEAKAWMHDNIDMYKDTK